MHNKRNSCTQSTVKIIKNINFKQKGTWKTAINIY